MVSLVTRWRFLYLDFYAILLGGDSLDAKSLLDLVVMSNSYLMVYLLSDIGFGFVECVGTIAFFVFIDPNI